MLNTRNRLRRRRGFTLTEVMIAASITGLVMATLAGLQFMGARVSHELSGKTHMRSARMQAIDAVRYRLMDGRIGSCVISAGGRQIDFEDPNKPGTTSRFFFVAEERTLYFIESVGGGSTPVAVARGPINITFELQSNGAIVLIKVKSASEMPYADIDEQDGEIVVFLRNS